MLYEDRSLFSDNVQIWGRGVFSAVFYFFVINHKEIGFAETISFPYICFEGKFSFFANNFLDKKVTSATIFGDRKFVSQFFWTKK